MTDSLSRRQFLAGGAIAVAAVAATRGARAQDSNTSATASSSAPSPGNPRGGAFKLLYAPHFGSFDKLAGNDPIDQLKFMADEGFRAMEDNQMPKKHADLQSKIGETMANLNMEMGIFVAHGDFGAQTFTMSTPEVRDLLKKDMEAAVEVAKRVNAKWCTVVLDAVDPKMDPGIQMANAIDNLRACAEVLEKANLIAVLEPLNRWNHPNLYLTTVPQAYAICRGVNSPSIKILDDLYHAQIQKGDLIPDINYCWDEIAYFQVGDNPGRNEPGTGEINYRNVFKHIHQKGYKGIIGMEHGKANNTPEGERAVIKAYHDADNFEV